MESQLLFVLIVQSSMGQVTTKMAAAPVHFNVVFGINETPLTHALETRRFDEALDYINSHYGMCLDEGFYQRIPLYIVLSGETSLVDGEAIPIHLKIARRLIERGADPNMRMPETCGAEYVGPGTSPLQCVVNLYDLVTNKDSAISGKAVESHKVLSLNGKAIKYIGDLTEELINVVWLLLGHGAQVNVRDIEMKTPLHTTLLRSKDLRMAQTLCDNGADLMASDCQGNTPLMSVCCPLPWRDGIEQGPCLFYDISEAVHFLLSFENVKIDHCGIHSRTALFYAMQSANLKVAKILLDRGADPSLRGLGPDGRYVSPLLAAFIPWSSIGRNSVVGICQEVALLVDKGYFSTKEILAELLEYASWGNAGDKVPLLNLNHFGTDLVLMMFGQTTCKLTQLASRAFIDSKFAGNTFGQSSLREVMHLLKAYDLPTELIVDFQIV
ncbi:ankyrin-3-like [Montipora capricornis]|uniref:ankyrin-3-like n=1 Tax=Montipora capricornis TaxID=246305 RepID=UPI0035F195E4